MGNKLKIGFFTDTYKPQVNGVVSSIEIFRQELEKRGHQVYIFCPRVNDASSTRKIIRFRSFKFVFQPEYYVSLPFTRHLLKNFWHQKLDIVHAHTPFSLGHLAYYYSTIKRVPFVHTYHTLYPEYIKSYVFKGKIITPKMVAHLTAAYSNRCDLNIAPSVKIKKLLISYGVKQPISVIPTGVKLSDFKKIKANNFRKKYKIKQNDKVLLYVGRLGQEKNVQFLINSFYLISRRINNSKLVIIGNGPDYNKLEGLVRKLNLQNRVIFTGYLAMKEVVKAYQASDLFVFASQTDTQGMVILEAAASGLPIVAVKDEAFSNILQDKVNGFFVKKDKPLFSRQTVLLLTKPALYKKMSANSIKIAKNFTSEEQTQKLLAEYYNLI